MTERVADGQAGSSPSSNPQAREMTATLVARLPGMKKISTTKTSERKAGASAPEPMAEPPVDLAQVQADFERLHENARKLQIFIKRMLDKSKTYLIHLRAFYEASYSFSDVVKTFYTEHPELEEETHGHGVESMKSAAMKWEQIQRMISIQSFDIWKQRLEANLIPALTQHLEFFGALETRVQERNEALECKLYYKQKLARLAVTSSESARMARNVAKSLAADHEYQQIHEELSSLLLSVWISRFSLIDPLLIEFVRLQLRSSQTISQNLQQVQGQVQHVLQVRDATIRADAQKQKQQQKPQQQQQTNKNRDSALQHTARLQTAMVTMRRDETKQAKQPTQDKEESDDENMRKTLKKAMPVAPPLHTNVVRTVNETAILKPDQACLPPALLASDAQSKYRLLESIGQGNYGTVYLAEWTKIRDSSDAQKQMDQKTEPVRCVVKKIPCTSFEEANFALREAVHLCCLSLCPSICTFRDVFLESDSSQDAKQNLGATAQKTSRVSSDQHKTMAAKLPLFYVCLVTDFYAGGDLRQQIDTAVKTHALFDEAQILDWLLQICIGLAVIHSNHLIHRDIKPANIFIDQKAGGSSLRIGDFGIAAVLHRTRNLAQTHIGTPAYMAPEILGDKAYDEKSDIWSLGCLAFELLTLEPPSFQFKTLEHVLAQIDARYSTQLKDIVASMLHLDASKRATASDLLDRLRILLSTHQPVTIRESNPFFNM